MKKYLIPAIVLAVFSMGLVQAKETKTSNLERFYGKIIDVNLNKKMVTAYNKKRKQETDFRWNNETKVIHKKKAFDPKKFKVDQYLIISYVTENDVNLAKRITVRVPYKRRKTP